MSFPPYSFVQFPRLHVPSTGTEETPCAGDPDYSESGLLLFSEDSLTASNSVVQGIMEELVEAIEKNDTVTGE